MNTIITNPTQTPKILQKGPERSESSNREKRADKSPGSDTEVSKNHGDTVQIQNNLAKAIEANNVSGQSTLNDVEEANKLLQEVKGLLSSEGDKAQLEQVFDVNKGNLAGVLM